MHTFNSPSEPHSCEIEDAFPSHRRRLVNHDDASPCIVYSSPSSLSTADLSSPSLSTSDGFLLSSPNVSTHIDNFPSSPSPNFPPEDVTLPHCRGAKRLLSLRSNHNRDAAHPPRPKSPFASLSPPSPRFTLGLLRRSDLDSPDDKCLTDCYEDVFDPFSRASPSVFYPDYGKPSHEPIFDSWLFHPEASSETDDPEAEARSPLNDLSVYLCRPPQPQTDTPSNTKSRLHIWVSGIEPQSPTTSINLAPRLQIPPGRPRRKNHKPKLRPLVLPNLAALREIANAQQQESIASPTCPSRTAIPQQQQDAPRPTASSVSASPGLVCGRLVASPLSPPGLVTSMDAFPVALGSGQARRLTRESISEPDPVIVRRDGDGDVDAAPHQTDVGVLSQPQYYCSAPVPHGCERVRLSHDQDSEAEAPCWLKHWHEGEALRRLNGRNCDKPLPEEPQNLDKDKPLPRDPLEKPLPQVPSEGRLDGLITLLRQAGVIADMESAQLRCPLALACGSGHSAKASVSPKILQLKGSASTDLRRAVLGAMNDRASQDRFANRSSSLWSIATQWAYAL